LGLKEDNHMIVLNVTYKCHPGKRSEFLSTIKNENIDVASRAEAGNVKYDYYVSAEDADEILLLEKWKDAEAIDKHRETAHFKRLGELKADYVADTVIERYEV